MMMSDQDSVRKGTKVYVSRVPYVDPWVSEISPENIFDSYESEDPGYLFVWINKTAGVSVAKAIGVEKDRYNHYTAAELQRILGRDTYDKMFTFAFVRNPWDKVYSEFRFRIWTHQNELTPTASFADWVRATYVHRDPRYHDWPKMFLPQIEWLTDGDGRIAVDFIGRFENLQRDFDRICDSLGKEGISLTHENQSRKNCNYRDKYDDKTRSIVEDHFKADIDFFGYQF
jgi:hypothetical protein